MLLGIPECEIGRLSALVYILSAIICGVAGIILSSTVKAYVPLSGNAYLLDAIGATFIGTTLHPLSRPSVFGTALGVLLLSIVTNGLLLIGWNFYWQQVASGILIFAVLAVSFLGGGCKLDPKPRREECVLSRRDSLIVARHFVPGYGVWTFRR